MLKAERVGNDAYEEYAQRPVAFFNAPHAIKRKLAYR